MNKRDGDRRISLHSLPSCPVLGQSHDDGIPPWSPRCLTPTATAISPQHLNLLVDLEEGAARDLSLEGQDHRDLGTPQPLAGKVILASWGWCGMSCQGTGTPETPTTSSEFSTPQEPAHPHTLSPD